MSDAGKRLIAAAREAKQWADELSGKGSTRSDLVIRKDDPDLRALVEALKWMGAERKKQMRTADYHGGECLCCRCAEDAVFDALATWEMKHG